MTNLQNHFFRLGSSWPDPRASCSCRTENLFEILSQYPKISFVHGNVYNLSAIRTCLPEMLPFQTYLDTTISYIHAFKNQGPGSKICASYIFASYTHASGSRIEDHATCARASYMYTCMIMHMHHAYLHHVYIHHGYIHHIYKHCGCMHHGYITHAYWIHTS